MKPDRNLSTTSVSKVQALRQSGTLNPRAKKVQDRLFLEESFFDPQDLTQIKYEMLRRVRKEAMAISAAVASFGFSRPAFYKAQRDFTREGLAGLIPRRRGPKGGHKVTQEVVMFADQLRDQEPSLRTPELLRQIQKKFALRVHRRTLERALVAAKKKTAHTVVLEGRQLVPPAMLTEHYEGLRAYVLARHGLSGVRLGQGTLMARGMAVWIQVAGELIPPVRSEPTPSWETTSLPMSLLIHSNPLDTKFMTASSMS
jgi:predicted DNA-binding protein (UPF0251 family)